MAVAAIATFVAMAAVATLNNGAGAASHPGAAHPNAGRGMNLAAKPQWGHDAHGNEQVVYRVRLGAAAAQAIKKSPRATTNQATPAQVVSMFDGVSIGPSWRTHGGKATITNIARHDPPSGHPYWTETVKVTHPNPTMKYGHPGYDSCPWYDLSCWAWSGGNGLIDSATNPANGFWGNHLSKCVAGTQSGYIGAYEGGLISHVWFYISTTTDDVMDVTPAGLARSLIIGCTAAILKPGP